MNHPQLSFERVILNPYLRHKGPWGKKAFSEERTSVTTGLNYFTENFCENLIQHLEYWDNPGIFKTFLKIMGFKIQDSQNIFSQILES